MEQRQEGQITTEQLAGAAVPQPRSDAAAEGQQQSLQGVDAERPDMQAPSGGNGAPSQPGADAATRTNGATATDASAPRGTDALLAENETSGFRMRWEQIQIGFVDRPREAVQEADTLVAEVMRRLAETFADARARLEGEWSRGADVGTEELRIALQRYRSFFELLLRH